MRGHRFLFVIVLLYGTVIPGWAFAQATGSSWGLNPAWDDGLAEVATYDAERVVYKKTRRYEVVLITVKEDFNATSHAKADPPYEGKTLLPVLKLNGVATIQTENYPYHYLTSAFVRRDDVLRLEKLTNGSQEWCGNTFKEIRAWGERPEMLFHSYWDGEGDGSYALGWEAGDLAEDQLPLSLRGLPFRAGFRLKARMIDTQATNRAVRPKFAEADIRVAGEETVSCGIGPVDCWRVEVARDGQTQCYWFEKAYPNILVKFESPDGRKLLLKTRERRKYW
ncbi:MAG: hypothetical protein EXS64_07910 [Candidatus Latescibacteria bacterium]|nr:hypothetical protein [Candidatus Latescibacterota bacterium]